MAEHLQDMPCLTHLCLMSSGHSADNWLNNFENRSNEELVVRWARVIKKTCPSLRYLQLDLKAWQFVDRRDSAVSAHAELNSSFDILDLEWEEVQAIDIFANVQVKNMLCGLPLRDLCRPAHV